MIKNISEV